MCNNCQSREFELVPELESILQEYSYEDELYSEVAPAACGKLSAAKVGSARTANRIAAKDIGWGCLISGKVNAIPELLRLLRLGAAVTEADLACAIATWQAKAKLPATGILDKRSWATMNLLPKSKYPLSTVVYYGGRKLGIMEKTAAYRVCYLDGSICRPAPTAGNDRGAMHIELGFRITDMDAVKKAGFVDAAGKPQFRWIQVIETNQTLNQTTGRTVKKYSKYVDPIPASGAVADNPYYWNEPGVGDPNLQVTAFMDRPSSHNHLCYHLLFEDQPSRSLASASAGKRVFWNAEVALVGVRKGNKNVLLNAFTWGFDIVINSSGKPVVKPNGMFVAPRGGSAMFVRTLNNLSKAGQFPTHCFAAGKFSGKALCV